MIYFSDQEDKISESQHSTSSWIFLQIREKTWLIKFSAVVEKRIIRAGDKSGLCKLTRSRLQDKKSSPVQALRSPSGQSLHPSDVTVELLATRSARYDDVPDGAVMDESFRPRFVVKED